MLEFGRPLRGGNYADCMNAVYRYLMPCWGAYGENGFSRIPEMLKSLKPVLSKKEKFLGGMYDLNLKVHWKIDDGDEWTISMRRRIGRTVFFGTKSKDASALALAAALNGKVKLLEALDGLDLSGLTISRKNNLLELCLTPYGGGICYLALPPVRYTVPLPPGQRNRIVWTLEQLAKLIMYYNS
jgi:hypothetical protein